LVDAETLITFKDFMARLGCDNIQTSQSLRGVQLSADSRSHYLFNTRIPRIEDADVVLLIGTNPRMEAPVVCARIRKSVRQYDQRVAYIGPEMDLAMKAESLGNDVDIIHALASGTHPFSQVLASARHPIIILGMGALARPDGAAVHNLVEEIARKYNVIRDDWNGFNVLHTAAVMPTALDLGFVPSPAAANAAPPRLVYLVGADDEAIDKYVPRDAFVIYQGHHGDIGANRADVVLPTPAYTEKMGTYVNMDGRVQRTRAAIPMLNNAREDWAVFRALSEILGNPLPYDSLRDVHDRLIDVAPHMGRVDLIEPYATIANPPAPTTTTKGAFSPFYTNYWMTNSISRSSRVMAKCVANLPNSTNSYAERPSYLLQLQQPSQQPRISLPL